MMIALHCSRETRTAHTNSTQFYYVVAAAAFFTVLLALPILLFAFFSYTSAALGGGSVSGYGRPEGEQAEERVGAKTAMVGCVPLTLVH